MAFPVPATSTPSRYSVTAKGSLGPSGLVVGAQDFLRFSGGFRGGVFCTVPPGAEAAPPSLAVAGTSYFAPGVQVLYTVTPRRGPSYRVLAGLNARVPFDCLEVRASIVRTPVAKYPAFSPSNIPGLPGVDVDFEVVAFADDGFEGDAQWCCSTVSPVQNGFALLSLAVPYRAIALRFGPHTFGDYAGWWEIERRGLGVPLGVGLWGSAMAGQWVQAPCVGYGPLEGWYGPAVPAPLDGTRFVQLTDPTTTVFPGVNQGIEVQWLCQ